MQISSFFSPCMESVSASYCPVKYTSHPLPLTVKSSTQLETPYIKPKCKCNVRHIDSLMSMTGRLNDV